MTRTLLCFLFLLPAAHMAAQCEFIIPGDAMPVAGPADTTVVAAEGLFWVCTGVTGTFTGDNSMILGEEGSHLHIEGNNNTIITRGMVMLHGMNNNVYAADAGMVEDMGFNSNIAICSEVVLNTEQAPAGGCVTTSIREAAYSKGAAYPNPFHDELMLTTDRQIAQVSVLDVNGRLILEDHSGSKKMDLVALGPGIYQLLVIHADGTSLLEKVVKE